MNTKLTLSFSGAIIALVALAGCSGTGNYASTAQSTAPLTAIVDVMVATTTLGQIVVDGNGMTAYFYDLDSANSGKSVCAGQCAANWPTITSTSGTPKVTGVTGKVGVITGTNQVTINGRPIYTYALDPSAGSVNGQGVGGIWYVVAPNGDEIKSTKVAKKRY